MNPVLQADKITKKFPGVTALRDVTFDLHEGEIHALCGENGAGKSTLIKLLSGLHPYGFYEGELFVRGQRAKFRGIADARRAGIAVIYQELALAESMTVAENIFLGCEPRLLGFVDTVRMRTKAAELLHRFHIELDPDTPISQLGVGQKQLVEIVKALAKESRALILDEPTAALAEHETQVLMEILRDLRGRGMACIYISHRLDEVFAIADRITVLRDGETVYTAATKQTNKSELIRHMVGRDITDLYPARVLTTVQTPVTLRVSGLSVAEPHTGALRLQGLSFEVRAGEVLGLGGLMGAGRTELLMHLFGAWGRRISGSVELCGKPLKASATPAHVLRRGMALVSEERRRYGLVLGESVGFNLSLSSLARFSRCGILSGVREFSRSEAFFRRFGVKATGLDADVGKLSGGNQQKVVLGKALMTEPAVVLLDEPTRGIDVGAKAEIYQLINDLTAAGKAVILVSSELPELIGMSDRILMLHAGRIAGEFGRDATQEKLLAAAMGQELM